MAQFDPTVLKQLAETMRQSGAIDCLARPDWAGVLRGRSQYVQAVAVAIADLGLPVGQEDFETTRSSLGEGEWDEATQRSYCRR